MRRLLRLPRFPAVLLARGVAAWVGLRLLAAWAGMGLLNVGQALLLVAMCGGAVLLDARRRGEHVFLANLGVPGWSVAALGATAAAALELGLLWAAGG